jgi:cysteine desulfurase
MGTVNAVLPMSEACAERGILFHTDATQAIGKIPFDMHSIPADLVSFSGHKIYAPKGIGVLFVRERKRRINSCHLSTAGGQERGVRAGTENVPGIVGLGYACEIISQNLAFESARIKEIRDILRKGSLTRILELL